RSAGQERRRRRQRTRHRRAGHAAAPQDRAGSLLPALSAHGARPRLPTGGRMTIDSSNAPTPGLFERIARWADRHSPQTLFARALIILVVPMLLLQAVSAWWFYTQRGDNVTNRLAILLVRDLRMLISLRGEYPDDEHRAWIVRTARQDL